MLTISGAVVFNGSDMGNFDFGTATAVDQAEAGNGTAFPVGTEHGLPEVAIPYGPACKLAYPTPGCQMLEWLRSFGEAVCCLVVVDAA